MGFADRAEKNLMSSKSSCKDFKPNIFNKTKCQNCFRTREAHTLDKSDSEKPKIVLLCGYLYIAPGIDFSNPSHKGRKWQRRCFILYENGELCYALDDNPATIPQGHIDMYTCVNINNSDSITRQLYSLAIKTTEEVIYIRAETREEKESWLEILSEYPKINEENARQNKKRKPVYPMITDDLKDTNKESEKSQDGIKQPLKKTESDFNKKKNEQPTKDISRSISCPPGNQDTNQEKSFSEEIQKVKDENHNRSWSDGFGKTSIEMDVEKWLNKREGSLRSVASIDFDGFSSSDIDTDDDQCFRNDTYRSGSSRQSSLSSPSPRQESKKNNDAVSRMKKRSGKSTNLSRSASARHVRAEPLVEETGTKLSRSCSAKNVPKEKVTTSTPIRSSDTCLHRNNNNVNDYAQSSRLTRRSNCKDSGSGSPRNVSPIQDSPVRDSPDSDSIMRRDHDTQRRNSLKLIEQGAEDSNITISTEELDRIDASSKSKFKFNKSLLDGESPSPSRRTIERRRHAQERKGRHTLDGSLHVQLHGEPKEEPKLKRSNSDPNLSEADDMLKRKEIAMTFPGLFHLKKGWLIKQGESEQDWSKHWFVLCDNKLTYYKDQQAEEDCSLSGVIELANCIEARSTTVSRNYGFAIRTPNYSIILAAMTSGIKNNWVQAINKAIATARSEADKSPSSPCDVDGISGNSKGDISHDVNVEKTIAATSEVQDMSQPPSRNPITSSSLKLEDDTDTLDDVSQIESDLEKDKLILDSDKSETRTTVLEDTTTEEVSFPDLSKKSRERKNKRRARSKTDDRMEKDIEESMKASKEGGILRSKSSSSIVMGQRTSKESSIKKVKIKTNEYSSPESTHQEDLASLDTQQDDMEMLKKSESSMTSPDTSVVELLETQVDSLQEQLTSTRTDLENSNKQKMELNTKMDRLIREHQDEMSEVMKGQSVYETQLEKLRQKKNFLEDEKQRMIDELNQRDVEKVNLEQSKQAVEEIEALNNRCVQLESELSKSKDELSKNRTTMKLEREKVTGMIEKLNDRIDGLEEEIGDKKVLLQEAESQATIKAKQVRELETLLRQSKSGQLINDLMAELTDTRGRLEESETVVIQNEERFEKRYLRLKDKLRAENNVLKNQLQLAEEELKLAADANMIPLVTHNEVVGNLKNELELNESANVSLQQKCAELQNELAQIVLKTQGDLGSVQSNDSAVRLEQELEDTKGELKLLKEALENEKTSGANLSSELEEERYSKAVLLKQLEDVSDKLKQNEQELLKQADTNKDGNKQIEAMVERKETAILNSEPSVEGVDLPNLRVQLKERENEVKKLMEQILEKEKENKTFIDQLNLKENEFQEAKTVYETSLADFIVVKDSKAALEKEIALLQKELESLKTISEEQSVKFVEDLQQKDNETKSDVEQMKQKLKEMNEAEYLNNKRFAELEQQILQKTHDIELLEEQGKSKSEKFEKDSKKLRTELKEAQHSFDELEFKHIQTKEDFKKMEKSQEEQIQLMGSRIKDLTTKLAAAERKVRDASRKIALEQKSKFSKGRSSSREFEMKLKELETELEDVELEMEAQENDTTSLEGKIKVVSDTLKKNGQGETMVHTSSGGEASEELESSVQDFNGSVSSTGNKLDESEEKLRVVTRKLVDLTAKELDNRKSYQVKCTSERMLKQEVIDLKNRLESVSEDLNQAPLEGELVAQQKFHRDLLEEQTTQYQKELEELKNKREKELEEEAQATAKAISALKRVHNEELQRERMSVSEMMSDDVEGVMKRHREVVNRMEKEWRILSEKYSSQCRENVNLQRTVKTLKQTMEELQRKKEEIVQQNVEVTTQLEKDVEDLQLEMQKGDKVFEESDLIRKLQIQLRIKEIELKCSLDDMQKSKVFIDATKKENSDLQEQIKHLQNEKQLSSQRVDLLEFQVNSLQTERGKVCTSGEGPAIPPEGSVDCEEVFESPVSSPGQFDAKYNPWFPPENTENPRHPLDSSSSSTHSDGSAFSSSKIEHV
ncbi:uncharacterized protein [Antedon mediterranea]|uniref:uncharacterized protein isoform X2 n=1 Tax=Antedon mediterranea TaxID=105859 RepID=UPI003AF962BB